MTGRVPKLLSFVNNSSYSYFVFKKPLHQKMGQGKKESSLYLYKLPLDTYPGSVANKRQTLLSSQHIPFYSRHYALMTFPVKLRNMSTCFGICNLSYYSSGTILMISFDDDCLCIEGKMTEHL